MKVTFPTHEGELGEPTWLSGVIGTVEFYKYLTFASSLSFFFLQHLEDCRVCQVWSCQLMEVNPMGDGTHTKKNITKVSKK
jgi:hypothetical protein